MVGFDSRRRDQMGGQEAIVDEQSDRPTPVSMGIESDAEAQHSDTEPCPPPKHEDGTLDVPEAMVT